jgi:pyrimidine-nucleoside phosphorylase
MRAVDVIEKKRDKKELNRTEIEYFIRGYTAGEIPDYQAAAWAMAVLLNGMTAQETTDLTLAMAYSGEILDLSHLVSIALDKHSTGGVGDKTTLVVEPIVAACNLPVGKMSGRGLGFSGGTLDKMESIPGYRTDLTTEEFLHQLADEGLVLTGQTADLAPADGKLYALRDVTATVKSMPLIASSVMSKKIAAGAQAIVLDVKVGLGAFMQTLEDARSLARLMVDIARLTDRKAVALLADMNQPLGQAVGNALEVREAIDTLLGGGPPDFREHCLEVASHMLVLGGKAETVSLGRKLALETLLNGTAWERFKRLVSCQGGDVRYVEEPQRLPAASLIRTFESPKTGYISRIDARIVGETAVILGAGRTHKGDPIDYAVGIQILHKIGDFIQTGQPLFTVHARNETDLEAACRRLMAAHRWSQEAVTPLPYFYGVIQ